jgi:uncharacterized metal-binding protein YceD (DUF177 family)
MKIRFDKINQIPKPFSIEEEGIVLSGALQKRSLHQVVLAGEIEGKVIVDCDRCGAVFDVMASYPIDFTLSDVVAEDKDDLDIIEFLDGEIDISFVLRSEINAIRGEYHYCEQCAQGKEEEFEIEF